MKKSNRHINLIIPIIYGALFYLVLTCIQKVTLYLLFPQLSLLIITIFALALYAFIIGVVSHKINLLAGYAGYKLSSLMFAIILPVCTHISLFYYSKEEAQLNSILERDQVEFVSIGEQCNTVKYGMFSNATDTIIRYTENGKDYQLIKFMGQEQLNRITWTSACEYLIIEQTSSVSKYIKLGNFDGLNHYMYSKPVSSYRLEDETLEYLLTLRID